jgi:hypothetical protein
MVRSQLVIVVTLLACAVVFGADPPAPEGAVQQPHRGQAAACVIPVPKEALWKHKTHSPDEKQFAIYFRAGLDEIISIHDAASGKQLRSIVGHGDEVVEFKFSDDGKLLASRCTNRNRAGWAVWDVATGKLLFRLPENAGRQLKRPVRPPVDPALLKRLKADQDLAVAWFKKELKEVRVKYTDGRVVELVFEGSSDINDDVLEVAATFPGLEALSAVSPGITDEGMKSLSSLKELKKLQLIDAELITDDGLTSLAGLKKLEVLDLSGTNVTDAGIERIKGLTNLRHVDLDFTKVSDRGLKLLQGNENLERLDLASTPISDEGMKSLAKFRRLRLIDLQGTSVSDVGLRHLSACDALTDLFVNDTKITREGGKRFNEVLPKCRIVFAPTDIG